jgi:SAM-dependent methyltransferase
MKPFAESCEQNRGPILAVIGPLFASCRCVLEIGSGTGQHAVHFARHMPHLLWRTSDLASQHAGIRAWLDEAALPNIRPPVHLDVRHEPWPGGLEADALFTANTLHIISWDGVEALFRGAGRLLAPGGLLVVYGPFNYDGRYTSESNARFDRWLKQRDPLSGVRDFTALDTLAAAAGLELQGDYPMPANNRTLCWVRKQ